MKYFRNVATLEELKKEYHRLAMKFHPDREGGDLEEMKIINAEYDEMFKAVKNFHRNKENKIYRKETQETNAEFKDIIDELIKHSNIKVEIIGSFIWVSGETKAIKDTLKTLGFRWHSGKKNWYKVPRGYRKRSRRQFTMAEIRTMFGSEEVQTAGPRVAIQ